MLASQRRGGRCFAQLDSGPAFWVPAVNDVIVIDIESPKSAWILFLASAAKISSARRRTTLQRRREDQHDGESGDWNGTTFSCSRSCRLSLSASPLARGNIEQALEVSRELADMRVTRAVGNLLDAQSRPHEQSTRRIQPHIPNVPGKALASISPDQPPEMPAGDMDSASDVPEAKGMIGVMGTNVLERRDDLCLRG